tara:strand:+ start:8843 stop:9718 length:876 start_codon:yes stop_codon:yes gene_type:complete
MPLKLIDCFSGLGVFSYAAEKLIEGNEFKTIAFVEQDPFCQKVLRKHWKSVPIFDDIRTYNPEPHSASVITAGFPCQSISNCGKGEGITETSQSGLFFDLMRVIRLVLPKFIILENVAAILNNGLDIVLGELCKTGIYECEWATFRASDTVQACHHRDRWFCICIRRDTANTIGTESRKNRKIQTGGNTIKEFITTDPNGFPLERSGEEREQIKPEFCKERLPNWGNKRILLNPNWRSWMVEPLIPRINDGTTSRLYRTQRVKALGNSIVAPCAAIPLQRVLELSKLEGYK